MLKRLMVFLFFSMFLISLTSATIENLGTFEKDNNISLLQAGTGFNACNISSVRYPDGNTAVSNVLMIADGTEYSYNLGSEYTSTKGIYTVNGYCTNGTSNTVWAYNFKVNESGLNGVDPFWIVVIAISIAVGLLMYGFAREEHPPITMASILFMIIALYIWVDGLGTLGATELIPRIIAASLFIVGATLTIKSLSELN